MPTQWSEAEQVPLGYIGPPKDAAFTVRRDVGIAPYENFGKPLPPHT